MFMKKTYIECLRIIAIILVIYNHTRELGFTLYQYTSDACSYYLSVFMIPVCKTAVPIFLMISGATLLGKKEDYRQLFSGRIARYVGIILFWGTLQYLRYVRTGKAGVSVRNWWNNIYSSPKLETYWYLYLYLGFLLLLPLLRKAVSGMTDKDYRYLFGLSCVSSILSMIGHFSGCFINYSVFLLPSVFLYPILGYWIDNALNSPHGKDARKYGLAAILPLCVIVPVSLIFARDTDWNGDFMEAIQCFTPIVSFGIFGFIKCTVAGHPHSARLKKAILAVGDTAFGIYLTEDMIRNQAIKFIVYICKRFPYCSFIYAINICSRGDICIHYEENSDIEKAGVVCRGICLFHSAAQNIPMSF